VAGPPRPPGSIPAHSRAPACPIQETPSSGARYAWQEMKVFAAAWRSEVESSQGQYWCIIDIDGTLIFTLTASLCSRQIRLQTTSSRPASSSSCFSPSSSGRTHDPCYQFRLTLPFNSAFLTRGEPSSSTRPWKQCIGSHSQPTPFNSRAIQHPSLRGSFCCS